MDEGAIIAYVGAIITFHGAITGYVGAIVTLHRAITGYVSAMINLTCLLSSLHPIMTFHCAIIVFLCNKHPYWWKHQLPKWLS